MSAEQYNGVARAIAEYISRDVSNLEERVSRLEGELMSLNSRIGEVRGEFKAMIAFAAVVIGVVSGAIQIIGILLK